MVWGVGGAFAPDFAGLLVFAEALECRVAEDAFGGPFGELDLADQLGLDPMGAAGLCATGGIGEGGFSRSRFLSAA